MTESSEADYQARVADEIRNFQNKVHVHELPDIFHYWSHWKIRPKLESFGFSSPTGLFEKFLEETWQHAAYGPKRFISIGSGNCDLEIGLAQHLLSKGCSDFVIDCLDINPTMLERGRAQALQNGMETQISCLQADFNRWEPDHEYDAVIACQALHHVVNLEELFKNIRDALKPNGAFITSDMVGRNGHQRSAEEELEAATARIWRLDDDNAALHHRVNTLENRLRIAADSRWIKLGRKMGFGPKLP